MSPRWYVAHTHPNHEWIAQLRLKRQGFEVFLPCFEENRRIARRMTLALAPLFPGYLFIAFNAAENGWRSINDTRGVLRLLSSDPEKPLPVPRGFVEGLQAESNSDGLMDMGTNAPTALRIHPGQQARILAGPFTGFSSLCEESSDRRIKVLLEIFGRPMRIDLKPEHVEAIAS